MDNVFTVLVLLFIHFGFEHLLPIVPEIVWTLRLDVLIQRVLDVGLTKVWQRARHHYEKDHAHRENVGVLSSVVLLLKNLWRLVLTCPYLRVMYT